MPVYGDLRLLRYHPTRKPIRRVLHHPLQEIQPLKYHRIYIEEGRASPPGKKPLKKTPYSVYYNGEVLLERTL